MGEEGNAQQMWSVSLRTALVGQFAPLRGADEGDGRRHGALCERFRILQVCATGHFQSERTTTSWRAWMDVWLLAIERQMNRSVECVSSVPLTCAALECLEKRQRSTRPSSTS